MKVCAIQIPYAHDIADAEASVNFLIRELESCDSSLDLILTPEYSNTPAEFPIGENLSFAEMQTGRLVEAARSAARRCGAIVALSYCAPTPYGWRNLTRVFNAAGEIAGEYCKQHLVLSEHAVHGVDDSYTKTFRAPEIVEIDGIRLGFVICYDAYFNEYIEHIGYRRPDIVLVSAFQRGEPCENLRLMNRMLAYNTGAFVVRASVGMGENATTGGTSLVVGPEGNILADSGQRNGKLIFDIGDPHRKFMRSNSFGGNMIPNRDFIEQGRAPWSYRACGSCVKPGEAQMGYPRICAHRGFRTIAPENSLPAFGAAIALGAEEIEFDIWETADGVPVSIHDDTLDRVSNGHGKVREKTFAELEKLDFGVNRDPHFAGLRILKFEDILRRFPRQAVMNIHVKSEPGKEFSRPFVKLLADLLIKYDCASHAYFMTGPAVLEAAMEVAPWVPRCMSSGPFDQKLKIVERGAAWKCQKVQMFTPYFNQAMIDRTHELGMRCNFFYSDDPLKARQLLEMGVDTLLTNDYWAIAQVKEAFVRDRMREAGA